MIHTNRIVTVGEQESIIDRPIVLYRGDREVEIEFTLVGNEFTFSEEGNVIKSVNASHGQLVLNTPSGEHMFSELAECHEGKVVFVVTKEMIDEFIEMGFYSFQIRLYDSAEMKSRVTIPPVMNGFDIRNPIAAEDEANVVDQGLVDYARIFKDRSNEELYTFDWTGAYNKTEWQHHDVITENKLNKIEDALYSINANIKESDVVMLNTLDQVKKDADAYVKEHMAEVEADVEEFERSVNTNVEQFKIDTNAAMTAHKNEVSEVIDGFSGELESVNSQLAHNAKNELGVSVKTFGAIGDGITDDTDAIKKALNSNFKTIIMNCNCKISSTINLPSNKEYIFNGSFIVDDNFKSDKVIYINSYISEKNINKISIIHEKFYNKDYHTVENNNRTTFDGLYIDDCRKLNIKNVSVVGLTTRALVVNEGYETVIDKIDVWGSNLSNNSTINSNSEDNLNFTQNSRYTCGIVANGNDGIYNNVVSVGFNVGMSINNANIINNFHPWGYKSTMVYGLVVKGSYNIVNNLYLDTVTSLDNRNGAGVYECKVKDGIVSGSSIERNKYSNITTLKFDSSANAFELGDDENNKTSFSTKVSNLIPQYETKYYKLYGGAKDLSTLDNILGEGNYNTFVANVNNLIFDRSKTANEIIGDIIENHLPTTFNTPSSLIFTDTSKLITSKLPTTCALYNQNVIVKIEGYGNRYYRCSIQGYGWPNSNSYIIDVFRSTNGNKDYYTSLDVKVQVLSYLPSTANYSIGDSIFYKNKPIWKSSEDFWVDAVGNKIL